MNDEQHVCEPATARLKDAIVAPLVDALRAHFGSVGIPWAIWSPVETIAIAVEHYRAMEADLKGPCPVFAEQHVHAGVIPDNRAADTVTEETEAGNARQEARARLAQAMEAELRTFLDTLVENTARRGGALCRVGDMDMWLGARDETNVDGEATLGNPAEPAMRSSDQREDSLRIDETSDRGPGAGIYAPITVETVAITINLDGRSANDGTES